VIETVIRRMEAGMERWGIDVPAGDDEEEQRTELALAFDDAEFQADVEPEPVAASASVLESEAEPALEPESERLEAEG
jgi:hypothetical protein